MKWEMKHIEHAFPLIKNGASIKQDESKQGIPITRIETIASEYIDRRRMGYADIEDDRFADYYIKDGDILMSHINSWLHLGKSALAKNVEEKIIHGMNLLMLRPNKDVVSPEYAKYYFGSKNFKAQLHKISNQSVNQSSFAVTKLKKLSLPLPPLPTQRKIAAILDEADALRRKDKELLKKYDELLQAVFYSMFENRDIEVAKGEEIFKVVGGAAFKSEDYKNNISGIPLIRIGTVNKGYFDKNTMVYLPESFEKRYENWIVFPGDILMTLTGTVGKDDYGNIFQLDNLYSKYFLNQRVAKIEYDAELVTDRYLLHLFKIPKIKKKLTDVSRGVRQANISNNDIYNLEIPVPPIELQNAFATIVKNIEEQKAKVIAQQQQSEALFQSLLQRAFKGQVVE